MDSFSYVTSFPPVDDADWRTQLTPVFRQRIVNKIFETLKRLNPSNGEEAFRNMAAIFEWKIYNAATSKSDYLRKISIKMLSMEVTYRRPIETRSDFTPSSEEWETPLGYPPVGSSNLHPLLLVDSEDWRNQLMLESRGRVINKILETLRRHIPFDGQGLQELHKIAVRFEEKIYAAATSQADYLRKISLKMLTMESRSPQHFPSHRAEIETMADQIEEKMCSEAMNQQDYIQKLDSLKHAIDEAIMTQHSA